MSSLVKAVLYGAASAALYVLLYLYADQTVELARRAQQGEHIWFLAPIVIAFVFSYVHGNFTAHFWDAIGLNPAGKKRRK
jgi:predicted membrane-bound dolichyl-phosphate-mannose-protein mannosyltransferase